MRLFFTFQFCCLIFLAFGQKVSLTAVQTEGAIQIDGLLTESDWQKAPVATNFIENTPVPGKPSDQRSEVKMLYSQQGVYIGAFLFDDPDNFMQDFSDRDAEGNADWFGILFDTYLDEQNGYGFFVTGAGVQIDLKQAGEREDRNWDAVWESSVVNHKNGWSAEFFIPYSALRFPEKDVQQWGINFFRVARKSRQWSYWSAIDPEKEGFINQFGLLNGIEGVKPPVRLALMPYLSVGTEIISGGGQPTQTSRFINGGLDLKYGINESFTLDMTLVPDFGGVQSDAQVLNATPFEIQFDENRQFFTEGIELFEKADLFYSRRIGGRPINFGNSSDLNDGERFESNPAEAQLLNATKLSGRTNSNLGIGVFNAVTQKTTAVIVNDSTNERREIETDPTTNYSVLVLDQAIKNNSFFNVTNVNTYRFGSEEGSNVFSTITSINNDAKTFRFDGQASHSFTEGEKHGFAGSAEFLKTKGQWRYSALVDFADDRFNSNDLGFLLFNNFIDYDVYWRYNQYKAKRLNQYGFNGGASAAHIYKPYTFTDVEVWLNGFFIPKSFHSFGFNISGVPVQPKDFRETRTIDQFFLGSRALRGYFWVSTDYRKRVAVDIGLGPRRFFDQNRNEMYFRFAPRLRLSDKILLQYVYARQWAPGRFGYSGRNENGSVQMAQRDEYFQTNKLTLTYALTNRMNLSVIARHHWETLQETNLFELNNDGSLTSLNQQPLEQSLDFRIANFNQFTVDWVYTWYFAPGSELTFIWKNNILFNENELEPNLRASFMNQFDQQQRNLLTVKVLYFIDYNTVRGQFKNRASQKPIGSIL